MNDLVLPQEIPYFGWVCPNEPFFFRPRMRFNEELELLGPGQWTSAEASKGNRPELQTLPWVKHSHLALEYCSGNGHWIVEQAKKKPQWYWIALEKRLDRAKKILSKIRFEKLTNIAVACTEAKWFSRHFLLDQSLEAVFINFPDPWPKERHQHHRLFEPQFMAQVVRALKKGAGLQLVTDDQHYLNCAVEVMRAESELRPTLPGPNNWQEITMREWGYSFFAELWQGKGRVLYRTQFTRQNLSDS